MSTPNPASRLIKDGQTSSTIEPKPQRPFFQEISDDELIEKLANYGAYHNNVWNKIIHIICVPMVMWSLIIFFRWVGVIIPSEFFESINLDLTVGTFIIFAYVLWYVFVGRYIITMTYNMALIAMCMHANWLQKEQQAYWWIYFVVGQVVGWSGQLYFGHYLIEHSPAAVVGLSAVDSAMMAPIFSWWEIFFWCGYDPKFLARA